MATVSGYAFYAMINTPAFKYQKENSKDPCDKEYKVDLLMSPDDYKALTKKYKKQKKQELPTREEFVKRYGMEPPEDISTNADNEYCFMSFKSINAYRKDGKVVLADKPKVLIKDDNTGKLVETKANVGNGSKVLLQYVEFESKQWGSTSAKLKALRVDELIPYGADDDFSELGEVDEDSFIKTDNTPQESQQDGVDGGAPFEMEDDEDIY